MTHGVRPRYNLSQQLNVEIQEVEELLIGLILEGKVEGRIDQVGMRLELDRKSVPSFRIGVYVVITLMTGKVLRRNDMPH
jgi:hypothetical protein